MRNKSVYQYFIALTFVTLIVSSCDVRSLYLQSNEIVAQTIVAKMSANSLSNIAIVKFEAVDVNSRGAGEFLADRLIADMTTVPMSLIKVINREKMDEILEEHKLKEAGVLDRKTVIENGKMLGVDAIIIGKYKVLKNIWGTPKNLSITYEAIDIEKGITFYANTLNLTKGQFPEVVPYCY